MIDTALRGVLEALGSALVAYSGGVDSTYLAWASSRILGPHSLAVTADSPSLPRAELAEAMRVAEEAGFAVEIVRTDEFEREAYLRNAPDRCFHCKEALFDQLFPMADARGFAHVCLGTVTDDLGDVRPGLESARRRGARQPLLEAGLSKDDVRRLAREAGLPVWNKPQAACLSSRIPHGTAVTLEALTAIERAEDAIRKLGFDVVRVRHYGETARVEVDTDLVSEALAREREISDIVRAAGYTAVTIDTAGYRRGGARLPILDAPNRRPV